MRRDPDEELRLLRPRRWTATPAGRWSAVLLVSLALTVLTAPAAAAQDPPAGQPPASQQAPDDCDNLGNELLDTFCRGATDPASGPRESVDTVTNDIATSAGDSALRGLTAAVAAAGGWMLEKVGALVTSSTSPNVGADWFVTQYEVMLALAVMIALPMLLLSVAQSIVRQDASQALRSTFLYLPLAGLFSFAAPAIATLLISLSDWMAQAVSANAAEDARAFMTDAGAALTALGAGTATPSVPVFGVLIGAAVILLGAFSIWIELLLRSAAIYVAVLFLPLSFAAMVWPNTWRWAKRLIEFLIAIIFAKVFIVAIIALAASGLANSGLGDSFEGILASSALLLLAAFSPMALLRVIPIAEASLAQASSQRMASRRASYAGGLQTGSQMVTNLIQSRFRGGSTLSGTAAGRGGTTGAAGVAAAGAVAGARAATNGVRTRVQTTVDSAPGAASSAQSRATAAPAAPRRPNRGDEPRPRS